MENKKRVLLGMSGGVDSAVSAILLQNSGFEVIGVTMRLFEDESCDKCNANIVNDAKEVCDKIGITHYTYDFRDDSKKHVIDNFVEEYKNGRTPNPCIECNRYLKFGKMYELAKELNCEYIATGHYAKIEYSDKYQSYVLKKSNNENKDQSYFVYPIDKKILPYVIFPLEKFKSKEEIRKIAKEKGLFVASKPDSEDICFIPDNNHIKFLDENIKVKDGNIFDVDGKLRGKHTGFTHYTIGQRKGLGVQNPKPLYVVKINSETNEVIIGEKTSVLNTEVILENINILVDNVLNEEGIDVKVKVRYKSKEADAKAYMIGKNIKIVFELPQFAITPGQSCVVYIDDIVVAGGIIK